MRNSVTNPLSRDRRSPRRLETVWQVDRHPGARLGWLLAAFVVPLLVVAARLAQIQCRLADQYVAAFAASSESVEPISTVDGRIYSSDGRALAEDVERYSVRVHYRWLEEPPDEGWLTQQALALLPRADRRDRARLEAQKKEVRARRDELWRRLSELTGQPRDRLVSTCAGIQQRVERVESIVASRRQQRAGEAHGLLQEAADSDSGWHGAWRRLVAALTTAPRRVERDPIVVREKRAYHCVVDDVPLDVRAQIEAHPRWFPGVEVGRASRRVYYQSDCAPHVIGMRSALAAEELAGRKPAAGQEDPLDYRLGDRVGRLGIEASYESHLRGLRGARRVVRNRYGETVREETIREPRPGGNVELTLNLAVQRKMERLLDSILERKSTEAPPGADGRVPAGGCIVALDANTGAVLVAASAPRFDFGRSGTPGLEAWRRLADDPRHPLFHRATQMALPPGSVFKPLVAIALLESRRVDPDLRIECRGYLERADRFRCALFTHQGVGHGPIDLADALARSCNVYFFHTSALLGSAPIVLCAQRFGLGSPTGVDLPFERGGSLPEADPLPGDGAKGPPRGAALAETRLLSIGQSKVTVTPLQVARAMAAIANDGYLVTPHVARKAGPQLADDDGAAQPWRRQAISGLSPTTLPRIRAALAKVVSDPEGTGYKSARSDAVTIAGKTGTAEIGGGRADHAWFAGYAPAENPRIAFAVVLEEAGSGGRAAGPVARQLVEALAAEGIIQPARVTMRE